MYVHTKQSIKIIPDFLLIIFPCSWRSQQDCVRLLVEYCSHYLFRVMKLWINDSTFFAANLELFFIFSYFQMKWLIQPRNPSFGWVNGSITLINMALVISYAMMVAESCLMTTAGLFCWLIIGKHVYLVYLWKSYTVVVVVFKFWSYALIFSVAITRKKYYRPT